MALRPGPARRRTAHTPPPAGRRPTAPAAPPPTPRRPIAAPASPPTAPPLAPSATARPVGLHRSGVVNTNRRGNGSSRRRNSRVASRSRPSTTLATLILRLSPPMRRGDTAEEGGDAGAALQEDFGTLAQEGAAEGGVGGPQRHEDDGQLGRPAVERDRGLTEVDPAPPGRWASGTKTWACIRLRARTASLTMVRSPS